MTSGSQTDVVYRYYTTDLVTNRVLAEIPFKGVNYERAIKGAGGFSGSVAVLPKSDTLNDNVNLYNSTMPGKTGLYVVRNGVCVWGGIIWTRSYNVINRTLSVNASEFTSYLQHRRIWKTWGNDFDGSVVSNGSTATVTLDLGATYQFAKDSTVRLQFYEVSHFGFNGYYKVLEDSTTNGDGQVTFTVSATREADASGNVVAAISAGTYVDTTITVRTNTYDYVRSLIDAVSTDFSGIRFANDEINPELQLESIVLNKQATFDSTAGVTTVRLTLPAVPQLISGQEIVVQNVDTRLDGLHTVTAVNGPVVSYQLPYSLTIASEATSATLARVVSASVTNSVARVTFAANHNAYDGTVMQIAGVDLDPVNAPLYDGTYTVRVINATTIEYDVTSSVDILPKTLTPGQVTSAGGGNLRYLTQQQVSSPAVTVYTNEAHPYTVGSSVTVSNVFNTATITKKELAGGVLTYYTSTPHGFVANGTNTVTVSGIVESSNVTSKELSISGVTATLTVSTATAHGLSVGDTVSVTGLTDTYSITNYSYNASNSTVTFTTSANHNIETGASAQVRISGLSTASYSVSNIEIIGGTVTLTTTAPHLIREGDEISVSGFTTGTQYDIASMATNGVDPYEWYVKLEPGLNPGWEDGDEITFNVPGAPAAFSNAVYPVNIVGFIDNEYFFNVRISEYVDGHETGYTSGTTLKPRVTSGVNGVKTASSVSTNTITYEATDEATENADEAVSMTVSNAANPLNGSYVGVASRTDNTFTLSSSAYEVNIPSTSVSGVTALASSVFNVSNTTVAAVPSSTSLSYTKGVGTYIKSNVASTAVTAGTVTISSPVFNVTNAVIRSSGTTVFTVATADTNTRGISPASPGSTATAPSGITGTFTVTSVPSTTSFTYNAPGSASTNLRAVYGYATGSHGPSITYGTYGPFKYNSDPLFEFSTREYTGKNVLPTFFRGFEVRNVGEELDKYSDNVDGFEYRIDCSIDPVTSQFKRTFMLLPINIAENYPSVTGEPLPLEAFGADRTVFEFPGNVSDLTIDESAENSATRFFMVGNIGELGADISQPYAAASAKDLLDPGPGSTLGAWPILDDDEADSDTFDEEKLYGYAQRYLLEARPPDAKFNITVNGSLDPIVGTYAPGDWCSVIINDEFVLQRLASDLELRDTVLLRKIDSFSVSVPDSVTFPEKVNLTLIPEWQVDKIGE